MNGGIACCFPNLLWSMNWNTGEVSISACGEDACPPLSTVPWKEAILSGFFGFQVGRAFLSSSLMTLLQRTIEESIAMLRALDSFEEPLNRAAAIVLDCLTSGHKLLLCGNGGSASDATHLATEFLCRYKDDRRPYPAISLTANGEYMTAVCNDYRVDEIFARQVWGLGQKGDVLIALTTSGKSRNVLRAIEEANRNEMRSICFLGRDGGFTKGIGTLDIIVQGASTARIQEAQKVLFHVLCEIVEERLPKE
jgi:phosphoheptose isomerase